MLLRFAVENFLSLRDRIEISLVASALKDNEEGLINRPALPRHRILPSAIVYGANASGKSNLIFALSRMRSFVINSHSKGKPEGDLHRTPFLLDAESAGRPSKFEVDFIASDIRYTYGFELTNEAFTSEWLFAYPSGRAQVLFQRENQVFTFGRNLRGRNQTIADLTRRNSLFVSAAAQNDHHELLPIYRFFESIEFNRSISNIGPAPKELRESNLDDRAISFLSQIGTGVVGYRHTEEDISDEGIELQQGLLQLLKKMVPTDAPPMEIDEKSYSIELAHANKEGKKVYLDWHLESSGTRRLFILLAPIFKILDNGGLIIIDELDASLHTQACEVLLSLFSSPEFNKGGGQIIASVHDTNILRSTVIRRDQIWFCEKAADGHTDLYPLTDIQLRNSDNLEKGYLQGRFGAVPFSGDVQRFIQKMLPL